MKTIFRISVVLCLLAVMPSCIKNNIEYEEVYDIAEGIYITGNASEFSAEVPNGMLPAMDEEVLYNMDVWLKSSGNFYISIVDAEGTVVRYGQGENVSEGRDGVLTYRLDATGEGFTVDREGLYSVIVNKGLMEVNLIPQDFKILNDGRMTESGNKELDFSTVNYDLVSHVITWQTNVVGQEFNPTEYKFVYNSGKAVEIRRTEDESIYLNTSYTGPSNALQINVLTSEMTVLNNTSDIYLWLDKKGSYVIMLQYGILDNTYSAKIEEKQ